MELPRAILFDLDGTLTRPLLDFPRIKREMGIGERPILEALELMSEGERTRAEAILLRHEDEAAACSTLNQGCCDLLTWLELHGIQSAIITRNSLRSTRTVLKKHALHFQVIISRENGRFKPHPSPLLEACRQLRVAPEQAWMVGDGQFDVEAGLEAGMRTVWISHGRTRPFAAEPWRTADGLLELTAWLRELSDSLRT